MTPFYFIQDILPSVIMMYARTTAERRQQHAVNYRKKIFDLSKARSFHILPNLLFTEHPAM